MNFYCHLQISGAYFRRDKILLHRTTYWKLAAGKDAGNLTNIPISLGEHQELICLNGLKDWAETK